MTKTEKFDANGFSKAYEDVYYQSAFAIQQDLELGWGIAAVDTKQLDDLINIPWAVDKYNFTERIWRDKDKLIANLYQILSRHLILGSDPKKPINELAKVMNTTKHNAGRLVMTESAYFGSRAREDCFKELEVERYQIIATLDLKTSAICQEMDGQIFKMADYEIGTTAPPFHVYCRTTTAPYYDDLAKVGKRAARNPETGKTYYVPRDMTYKEWREEYIDKPVRKRYNEHDKETLRFIEKECVKKINTGRQDKHIRGKNNFKEGKSELTANPEKLLELYFAKGSPQYTRKGEWNKRVIFEHDENIGIYVSENGERLETKKGTMHYSVDKGVHIVPAHPIGKEKRKKHGDTE